MVMGYGIGRAGARLIAETPAVADLRHLDLSGNPIPTAGRTSVFRSPYLRSCEVVGGWGNHCWAKEAEAM